MTSHSGFNLNYRKYSALSDEKGKCVMDKKYTIAVAGTGDGDIIGTTKKNHVESGLLAA